MQLPLRDVNSFGCHVSAGGGYHSSQRGEVHRRVEEAGLGERCPFRGGHERLEGREKKTNNYSENSFIETCFYFESKCMLGELLL